MIVGCGRARDMKSFSPRMVMRSWNAATTKARSLTPRYFSFPRTYLQSKRRLIVYTSGTGISASRFLGNSLSVLSTLSFRASSMGALRARIFSILTWVSLRRRRQGYCCCSDLISRSFQSKWRVAVCLAMMWVGIWILCLFVVPHTLSVSDF